jgi:hypothetical protein
MVTKIPCGGGLRYCGYPLDGHENPNLHDLSDSLAILYEGGYENITPWMSRAAYEPVSVFGYPRMVTKTGLQHILGFLRLGYPRGWLRKIEFLTQYSIMAILPRRWLRKLSSARKLDSRHFGYLRMATKTNQGLGVSKMTCWPSYEWMATKTRLVVGIQSDGP